MTEINEIEKRERKKTQGILKSWFSEKIIKWTSSSETGEGETEREDTSVRGARRAVQLHTQKSDSVDQMTTARKSTNYYNSSHAK